jgi:hypothetical protein
LKQLRDGNVNVRGKTIVGPGAHLIHESGAQIVPIPY